MSSAKIVSDFTVVVAENQTKGKGQLGNVWLSEQGKNLTFSVFLDVSFLPLSRQFYLNCAVSVSLFKTLKELNILNLNIKWPNDILSDNLKVSGILIENIVKHSGVNHSIIGVGLNVNQTEFNKKLKATSLKISTGLVYDLDEILFIFLKYLREEILRLKDKQYHLIYVDYESVLFKKNKPATFKNATGDLFMGYIKGVNENGHLQILLEDHVLKTFQLKEVQLMY